MINRMQKIYKCNGKEKCRYSYHCQERCFYTTSREFSESGHRMLEYERSIEKGDKVAFIFRKVGEPIEWDEKSQRISMYLKDGNRYTDEPSMEIHRKEGRLK